jgi:hypothetical protein
MYIIKGLQIEENHLKKKKKAKGLLTYLLQIYNIKIF